MNRFLLGAAAVIAALVVQPAFAAPITVMDTTLDFAYSGFAPSGYTGFGFSGPAPTHGDFLGNDFNTKKMEVTIGSSSINFKFYTDFGGSDLGAHYADLFFSLNNNDLHSPASWTYGISLGTAADNFQGAVAKGLYALTGPNPYQTSQDIWGPQSGYVYGGGFIDPDGLEKLSPTRVTGGVQQAGWTVSANSTSDGSGGYIVDVILNAPSTVAFTSVFNQSYLDIFWGTADCSNDAIFAAVDPPIGAPEPVSLALFGTGLAGLAAYGRRRKKKTA